MHADQPRPFDLRCEHLLNPIGLDETLPRFSWRMSDQRFGAGQTAFELLVASTERAARDGHGDLWAPGKIASAQSHLLTYAGPRLSAHTRYFWRVRIWDHKRKISEWSDVAWWETGFLGASWPATWIGVPARDLTVASPARYLRHRFELSDTPVAARLHVSALGLFEPHINGHRVGRDLLTPGWTDYDYRVEYLTYDVTSFLKRGANALGAVLCDGWYCGFLSWHRKRALYGKTPALLAGLRVEYADGGVLWIGTSPEWKSVPGAIQEADLYNGQCFDARRENRAWAESEFDDRPYPKARRIVVAPRAVSGKASPPVRAVEEIHPTSVSRTSVGSYVFDLGQNMVGVARLRLVAPEGTRVRLRFAEMLNEDGTIYVANLRTARATDVYVCRGGGTETYEPQFTFHGFRYVELTGLPFRPRKSAITGVVWHSDFASTGSFTCSDPWINRLQSNIQWGQKGNFLDVPTDCPQRDERLGWSGDAQIFITTAAFNFDVATFFRKWLRDLRDGQHPNGEYPDVAPDVLCLAERRNAQGWLKHVNKGNAGWADAGVICPWAIYLRYGDTRVLEENYAAMGKWIGFQKRTSLDLIRPNTAYGDWLAVDAVTPQGAPTPSDLIGTAYFAHTAGLMAKIADVLGKGADGVRYRTLQARIVAAFNREFVTSGNRVVGDTQTGYLLALGFDLLPQSSRKGAVDRLVGLIERNQNRLATGFVGTPLLCPVLTRFGRSDVAYRLLMQRAYPSWLYPILNGATTMWERWNSWTKAGGFGEVGMNSFNHYAYGAVGEWLYSCLAGIDFDPAAPGGRRLLLRPKPGGGLTSARAKLKSPYGDIESSWTLRGRSWTWNVVIPPNTTARAEIPTTERNAVRVNRKSLTLAEGVSGLKVTRGWVEVQLQSGAYRIQVIGPPGAFT